MASASPSHLRVVVAEPLSLLQAEHLLLQLVLQVVDVPQLLPQLVHQAVPLRVRLGAAAEVLHDGASLGVGDSCGCIMQLLRLDFN